jgi:uncharacterized protein YggE
MRPLHLATAAAICLALPFPLHAQYPYYERQRSITVSGSASIRVAPDEITVGVGVETFAPTVEAATSQNDAAIKAVVTALRQLGLAEQKIKTEAMSLEVAYRDSSHPSRGAEGYFARKTLTVSVPDSATAERAVNSALAHGANRIFGIDYNTSKMRQLRDEAREQAARAALEKAKLLAGQFGAKVGQPITISEGYSMSYGGGRWNPYYGMNQSMSQNVSYSREGGASGDSSEVIPAGEMAVRAEVNVVFELQ